MVKQAVTLTVNGEARELLVDPRHTLLQVLREQLELKGTKRGCDQGACGACTVLVDGAPMPACLLLAAAVGERELTTIEGLAPDGRLVPVQQAFMAHGAVQCGFCTSGLLLAAHALLVENPRPDAEAVRHALSGNLCRCSGYTKVIDAVLAAAGAGPAPAAPA